MDTVIANKFIKTLVVAEEPPKGTDMQAVCVCVCVCVMLKLQPEQVV